MGGNRAGGVLKLAAIYHEIIVVPNGCNSSRFSATTPGMPGARGIARPIPPKFARVLVAAACGTGCSATEPAKPASDAAPADDGAPKLAPSLLPSDFTCDASLQSIRDTIFERTCAFDTCHSHNAPPWGLDLISDPPTIERDVVHITAGECPDWVLVEPGDPDRSFFWNKLASDKPACGDRMPRGIVPLPPAALSCVRDWILQL